MTGKINLVVDMYGCPNRCRHCWLGHIPHSKMPEGTDEYIVNYFRPFFKEIAYYSWLREPDLAPDYAARWQRDCEISVNTKPQRFELASFYRLCRDPEYAPFLKSVGVETVQLTFFGLEAMTDKYVGRAGAFRELLQATEVLLENGIAPRWQAFINKENAEDVCRLLPLIEERRLQERCAALGKQFCFFVHSGSCDGENRKLYPLRIHPEDIPEVLMPYHLEAEGMMTEGDCCAFLQEEKLPYVPHNEGEIVLNIASNLDVYYNFTHMTPAWKLGNLKTDAPAELVERIVTENVDALNRARGITVSELVRRYGDFGSRKIFDPEDYKSYLLNCYLEV